MKAPLRVRFWYTLHGLVNRLAWRFACPPGPEWCRAPRIDKTRWLWRLNDWCASGWRDWWLTSRREGR